MSRKVTINLCILTLMFLSGCNHLLYYPSKIKFSDEKSLKIPPEEIIFKDNSGNRLVGWYFSAPDKISKDTTLVFFHGNGGNISSHYVALYWLLNKGYDFFIFDYPGYGKSSGAPSPSLTVDSGEQAIKWVLKNKPQNKLVIFAQSLGGNVALRTISEVESIDPCLVVIDSSFASYREAARKVLTQTWVTWPLQYLSYILIHDSYAASRMLHKIPETHYIVVHGTDDSSVPYELGEDLFKQIDTESKEFWQVKGGRHIDAFFQVEYRRKLVSSLQEHCIDSNAVPAAPTAADKEAKR